jgi:maleylpyruvate isomerase
MTRPTAAIEGCLQAHRSLLQTIEGLGDDEARAPSLLPGWTRGHVLTHLARNADSVVRRLRGAAAGEVVDQYPGGRAGRAADIEAGAGRPAGELVADVRATAGQVDDLCGSLPDAAWDGLTRDVDGTAQRAHLVVGSRWREVEVHHADLGLGFTPARWSPSLLEWWLPDVLAALPERTDRAALLAWAIGRGPAPVPGPWR